MSIYHSRARPQDAVDLRSRQRKAHKKSKRGCRNCKLRRVKCDETKPHCKNCMKFGVSCNEESDLQSSFSAVATLKVSHRRSWSIDQHVARPNGGPSFFYPLISDNNSTFQLDARTLDRFDRFRAKTVLTFGSPQSAKIFQQEITRLAFANPYLMHVVQTLTAMHDRHLSPSPNSPETIAVVCHHWSQSLALFNQKLSTPIQSSDRDPLWATAILLVAIALEGVEASRPEEAWPLKLSDASDLDWLRMSDGKKAIWHIADPVRPGSIFHPLAEEYERDYYTPRGVRCGVDGIPLEFVKLYDLDSSSTPKNNPYYDAVCVVTGLLSLECDRSTLPKFLSFIGNVPPSFKQLLQLKDSRALLLLAYWYAKVCRSVWYIERRATLECQATCLYLERHHTNDTAIRELLHFPKAQCGLLPSHGRMQPRWI